LNAPKNATDKTSIATNSFFFITTLLLGAGFSAPRNSPSSGDRQNRGWTGGSLASEWRAPSTA
jgi:hypothetical protein